MQDVGSNLEAKGKIFGHRLLRIFPFFVLKSKTFLMSSHVLIFLTVSSHVLNEYGTLSNIIFILSS